jgi:micrococcal nuclease
MIPNDEWIFRATIKRIVDGDTIDVDIDLGFECIMVNQRLRLSNIDAPEVRTTDLTEKAEGLETKRRVEELLPIGTKVFLTTEYYPERGKYGRIIADIYIPSLEGDKFLTDILIEEGLAVPILY